MRSCREINAAYDSSCIWVYQAFSAEIAEEAVRLNRFGPRFRLNRMSWIKPSLGWMLYRSHYATLRNQERILRIAVSRTGFEALLGESVGSAFDPTVDQYVDRWRNALHQSDVRYQWDPDRDLRLRKLERRALQLGMRGRALHDYVTRWVQQIVDITGLVHELSESVRAHAEHLPEIAGERLYPTPRHLRRRLGMSDD